MNQPTASPARCGGCGHDFLIAYSCKGRGVCPACTTRRMAETAAHLVDQVFPQVPVRQWVLSFPKRLRYFLQHDPALTTPVLRIFLDAVEHRLKARSPGAPPEARFGAVTFVHRFGSALNANLHFHRMFLHVAERHLANHLFRIAFYAVGVSF